MWKGRRRSRCGLVFGLLVGCALLLAACAGKTTGAAEVTATSATLHSIGTCDPGQRCSWYWEYWPATGSRSSSARTSVHGPITGSASTSHVALSATITGLAANTQYRWVFCGSPSGGQVWACAGPNGRMGSASADPPGDYATFTTAPPKVVIGMNSCLGYAGGTQADLLTSHHIGYCRAGYEEHGGAVSETPAKLIANGLKVATVLIGNTDDSVPLSQITIGDGTGAPDPIRNWLAYAVAQVDDATSNAGADVPLEVGNEMYLKGGPGAVANPVKYGQMFAALAAARPNANLLFSSSGDYQRADGSWSQQASGGGWLGDALAAVPSLASRVKGFVNHPYGDMKPQPRHSGNSWGPGALPAQHDFAASLGYQHADSWYLTEYGSSYPTAGDGDPQATDARTAYSYFESFPYVKAILWFQFRDYDGMDPAHSGAFNDDNSPRPVVGALQELAAAQGQ